MLFFLIFTLTSYGILAESSWRLKKDQCGIKVWTQKVSGSAIDKYKVEGLVKSRPQKIIKALMNFQDFHYWHDGVKRAKILKEINNQKVIAYMEFDFPWPARNRDSIAYSIIKREKEYTKILIKQLKKEIPTKNIRVKKSEGFWKIIPAKEGALVSQELHAEPGGSLPSWLINSLIDSGPYKTLKGFRKYLKTKECY